MKIFIGHGRSKVWKDLKYWLTDKFDHEILEFNETSPVGRHTKEQLQDMLDKAEFAFLIMTAEDEHDDGELHARENVIHEIGLFQGRLGWEHASILLENGCAEFSNIVGTGQIRFPKGDILAKSEEIRNVLERGPAGQSVSSGSDDTPERISMPAHQAQANLVAKDSGLQALLTDVIYGEVPTHVGGIDEHRLNILKGANYAGFDPGVGWVPRPDGIFFAVQKGLVPGEQDELCQNEVKVLRFLLAKDDGAERVKAARSQEKMTTMRIHRGAELEPNEALDSLRSLAWRGFVEKKYKTGDPMHDIWALARKGRDYSIEKGLRPIDLH